MIVYGGTREQIDKQLQCTHYWVGPCFDVQHKYHKCLRCYCVYCEENSSDKDRVNQQFDGFVRRYFELLHELEAVRSSRSQAMDISEQRREQVWSLEAENQHLRELLEKERLAK